MTFHPGIIWICDLSGRMVNEMTVNVSKQGEDIFVMSEKEYVLESGVIWVWKIVWIRPEMGWGFLRGGWRVFDVPNRALSSKKLPVNHNPHFTRLNKQSRSGSGWNRRGLRSKVVTLFSLQCNMSFQKLLPEQRPDFVLISKNISLVNETNHLGTHY